ncbi:hypothetical protein CEK25_013545 [Fusarium fujikuroi]|nr:hypothetical protein CEK25_013545 [Fusarium fujikuroi]
MDNKELGPDVPEASHNEKNGLGHVPPSATGRRGSTAVNIVENPLKRVTPEQAAHDARVFAETHGMSEHAELFSRAALVARDQEQFNMVKELKEDERQALEYERDHKWHGPKMLWYSISLCAIGAATQGWDQTGSNGANLSFPQEFGLDEENSVRDQWIVGLVNSIIFLTAGLIGAFIVDPLNHYFGRRGEIFITACYGTRPRPRRPRHVFGIFLGFCANVIVKDTGRISWRLQLGSAFIPSFLLGIGIFFCPESPRWLMKHGKHAKGFRSMQRLRAHDIIAARDFYYSWIIYEEELTVARGAGYFQRLWDCFAVPRIRRANYGASTVMIAQQMCGINIISFYSSTIFRNAGYTAVQALYASLGYGAIQVIATIPTLFLIDTKGRRTLCLITFPFMCVFLLAAGLSLLNHSGSRGAQIGPVVLFVYLFTIAYSLGEGPVAFQYSAEVFPTIQREQGMAWAVCINNTFAGVLGLTFPRMTNAMTPTGAFGFYAGLNLIAWGMIFCFVRETKQLTLEELDQVFSVPTKQFISYETRVWLPYFFKRHILRKKNIVKPPPIIERAELTFNSD